MPYISTLFGKELCMFRTDLLSIIRSLNTSFTAIGICLVNVVSQLARSGRNTSILTSLAVNITSMINTNCNECSINPLNAELNPSAATNPSMDALPTNRTWQPPWSHGTYQHEAITSRSRQLLMMGTWLPETCWATIRREIKNTKSDI